MRRELLKSFKDGHLSTLQVDVFQVAVVEVEVAAISLFVRELHHVCQSSTHKSLHGHKYKVMKCATREKSPFLNTFNSLEPKGRINLVPFVPIYILYSIV